MHETLNTLLGTAGGVIGAIGGIAGGILLAVIALFTFVCIVPSFCLFMFLLMVAIGGQSNLAMVFLI